METRRMTTETKDMTRAMTTKARKAITIARA
jgi:hypothetical protein